MEVCNLVQLGLMLIHHIMQTLLKLFVGGAVVIDSLFQQGDGGRTIFGRISRVLLERVKLLLQILLRIIKITLQLGSGTSFVKRKKKQGIFALIKFTSFLRTILLLLL